MDCIKLLIMLKKRGYRGVTYQYLKDNYDVPLQELEECAKKVGVDLGYGVLFDYS